MPPSQDETTQPPTISRELLQEFNLPTSPLPVVETLRIMRDQMLVSASTGINQTKHGTIAILDSYLAVISNLTEEMIYLKALETYIRRGTMTQEILEEVMGELDKLRMSNTEKLQKMAEVLKQQQSGNQNGQGG